MKYRYERALTIGHSIVVMLPYTQRKLVIKQ